MLAGLGWATAQGQTPVSGSVHANTTWTRSGSPYQVTGNVRVEAGVTLTVEAGVQVRFAQFQGLTVDGTLRAIGNAGTPVVFTGATETPNWWSGIVVRNTGSAALEHTQIRYAGYWNRSGLLKIGTGDLTLRHTTFEHNDLAGLNLQPGSRAFVFEQNAFSHNTRGVQVGLNASFRDDDATAYADNGSDVFLEGGTLTQDTQCYLNPAYSILVGSTLTVGTSAKLEVLPGTVLKFAQFQGLQVDGRLSAVGTALAPIQFTDWRDDRAGGDANRDGAATAPAPSWWSGIVVRNTGSATLEHAQVRYAGYWNRSGLLKIGTGDLTLRHTTFEHNDLAGLNLQPGSRAFVFEQNAFSHNTRGVQVGLNASFRDDDATAYADNGSDVFLEGGTLTQDTQWYLNPRYSMLVGSSLTVGTAAQLEILPGTVLKFAQSQGLHVDGRLTAVGTAMAPIQFTDWRDDRAGGDANRDGAATAPAPNWWSGIVVRNAGSATLEHAQIRYAGYWNLAGVVKSGTGDLTLLRSTIQHTAGDGLRLENSTGEHRVERNELAENRTGVFVRNQAQTLVLSANLIEKNIDFGVRNQGSPEVDARGNWWGHAAGPRHAVLNPGGQGDTVSNGGAVRALAHQAERG
ncbi:MAG: right-handed parallel beta-helix repeat-containing protein [Verrucomicrobia bacterium]|nr:right-handed parallel beta-helix repeat-containing protein [Verrucomicrobiota bacterium]